MSTKNIMDKGHFILLKNCLSSIDMNGEPYISFWYNHARHTACTFGESTIAHVSTLMKMAEPKIRIPFISLASCKDASTSFPAIDVETSFVKHQYINVPLCKFLGCVLYSIVGADCSCHAAFIHYGHNFRFYAWADENHDTPISFPLYLHPAAVQWRTSENPLFLDNSSDSE